jgi:hypothetical protein
MNYPSYPNAAEQNQSMGDHSSKESEATGNSPFPGLSTEPNIPQWAYFGRPGGHAQATQATRRSWKNIKSFTNPTTINWVVQIPNSETVARLLHGFRPIETEDKWFIYAKGPAADGYGTTATIHFHRSWTGIEMAAVKIELSNPGVVEVAGTIMSLIFEGEGGGTRNKDGSTRRWA